MVTIKDVAEKAGVSQSTVSYVLNKKKKVKQITKDKIIKAAEELNYTPNLIARSLKTKKTNTIGIIIPDLSNIFFAEIIRGIENITNKHDFTIILCCTYDDIEKEKKYLNTLLMKDVDGLIVIGTTKTHHLLRNVENLPIVVVDRKLGSDFMSILVNNKKGGFLATNHLLERKKNEIYLFTGPLSSSTCFDRMNGYIDALKQHGLDYNESFILECELSYEGGIKATETIISEKRKFDAIFAGNDLIALGTINTLIKKGYKVPEDVSIVGYDDISTASIFYPALTTIRQPKYLMGIKAAELIIDYINKKIIENNHIVFEPELIIRESS
jgi:LacI family transcriptional regulator